MKCLLFTESRPARKDYNKLSGADDLGGITAKDEVLDNEEVCRNNCNNGVDNDNHEHHHDTDTDSSFTDFDIDEREEFSDESDYGELVVEK